MFIRASARCHVARPDRLATPYSVTMYGVWVRGVVMMSPAVNLGRILEWRTPFLSTRLDGSDILFIPLLFIPLSGNGLNRADLHADRTADAIRLSNTGFLRFTVIAQGRAAGGEAFLATNALIRIDDARRLVEVELGFIFFGILFEDTRPFGDDDRRFIFHGKSPVQRFFHGLQVQGKLHSVALRYYIFGDTLNGAYDSLFDIPDENRKESLLDTASLQLDMKHLEKTIQQILIGELQEKGYSQKDIAKLLNVSRQTIFNKLHR